MIKFCSLYSGSTGNSLLVQSNKTNILFDAGVSAKKITEALTSINVNPLDIDAIVVSHEHTDHIQGLGTFSKKFDVPVFANEKTWNAMKAQKDKISPSNINIFTNHKDFNINELRILPFSTPHDAADSCGFNVYNNDKKLSIATDLGHITEDIMGYLKNSSFVMLESNYEPEVLKCCCYPFPLKTRIAGPTGHLSNNIAGKTIAQLMNSGLKSVVLGHLSKESNFPELAYNTVLEELSKYDYNKNSININVASRFEPTDFFEVS